MKNIKKFFCREAEESLCVYSNIRAVSASPYWRWRGEVILSVCRDGKEIKQVEKYLFDSELFPCNDVDGDNSPLVDSEYERIFSELLKAERRLQLGVNFGEYNHLLN